MSASIIIRLFLVTLIWGYTWVLMKIVLQYMEPFTFAAWRFTVGTIVMLLIFFIKRIPLPRGREWTWLAILGFFQTTLVFALTMYGMKFLDAGISSVLFYTMPMWNVILAHFFLSEKITFSKIIAIVLGLSGLVSITGWNTVGNVSSSGYQLGAILLLLAAVSWAISNMITKKKFQYHNKVMLTAFQMLFGTLGLIALAFTTESSAPVIWGWEAIGIILFAGFFASAFCYTVWFDVLSRINSSSASQAVMLVPVFGLFAGWLQLGEQIGWSTIIGSALILAGIYLTTISHPRSEGLSHAK